MANVEVRKVNGDDKSAFPVFDELAKKLDEIRHRAFALFQKRGNDPGYDLEDWLKAERETFGVSVAAFTDQGDAFEIKMALPGFETKDVQVTAMPDQVMVQAESKHEKKSDNDKVLWSEFSSAEVCRCFSSPASIDPDKVTATLDKGVLRVTAPKVAEVKPKSVAVKAA
jgi:HSP20 family protein